MQRPVSITRELPHGGELDLKKNKKNSFVNISCLNVCLSFLCSYLF